MIYRGRIISLIFLSQFLTAEAFTAEICPNIPPKVDLQLAWVPYAGSAAFLIGKAKGFYKEEGIELNVIPGSGAGSTATNVAQGFVPFGESDTLSVILGATKNQQTKIIGFLTDKSSQAFGTINPEIKTPKDFEGHSVGAGVGTSDALLLPVLLKLNGGDISKVELKNVAPGVQPSSLLNGQIDVATSYLDGSFVSNSRLAKASGKTLRVIASSEFNLDIYRQVLIASPQIMRDNACLVRAMTRATIKGVQYTVDHPDEATKIILEAVPTLNSADVPLQVKNLVMLTDTPAFRASGIGIGSHQKVALTIRLVSEAYDISSPPKESDIIWGDTVR